MVESENLSPTGYLTAGVTTASHTLRFQPRPMGPLQPASEGAHCAERVREQASPGHAQPEGPRRLPRQAGRRHQGGRHHPGCSRPTFSRSGTSWCRLPLQQGHLPTSAAAERFPRPETLTGRPELPVLPITPALGMHAGG